MKSLPKNIYPQNLVVVVVETQNGGVVVWYNVVVVCENNPELTN
jgi:hypothetical protein